MIVYPAFSDTEPFDVFCYGQDVYKQHSSRAEIEDRVHFFVEECDQMQVTYELI